MRKKLKHVERSGWPESTHQVCSFGERRSLLRWSLCQSCERSKVDSCATWNLVAYLYNTGHSEKGAERGKVTVHQIKDEIPFALALYLHDHVSAKISVIHSEK